MIAYARKKDDKCVVVIIPFTEDILQSAESITVSLPANTSSQWNNIFTNENITSNNEIDVLPLLKKFPVGVLVSEL